MKRFVEVNLGKGFYTAEEVAEHAYRDPNFQTSIETYSIADLISQVPDIEGKIVKIISDYGVEDPCEVQIVANQILQLFKEVE